MPSHHQEVSYIDSPPPLPPTPLATNATKATELLVSTSIVFVSLYVLTLTGGGGLIRIVLDAGGGVAIVFCITFWPSFADFILETLNEGTAAIAGVTAT